MNTLEIEAALQRVMIRKIRHEMIDSMPRFFLRAIAAGGRWFFLGMAFGIGWRLAERLV